MDGKAICFIVLVYSTFSPHHYHLSHNILHHLEIFNLAASQKYRNYDWIFQVKLLSKSYLIATLIKLFPSFWWLTHANRVVTESDVKFFAESLAEYKRQHEETTQIVENMSVGMLLCDASKLKTKMLPSPQKCLEVCKICAPSTCVICCRLKLEPRKVTSFLSLLSLNFFDNSIFEYSAILNFITFRFLRKHKSALSH